MFGRMSITALICVVVIISTATLARSEVLFGVICQTKEDIEEFTNSMLKKDNLSLNYLVNSKRCITYPEGFETPATVLKPASFADTTVKVRTYLNGATFTGWTQEIFIKKNK